MKKILILILLALAVSATAQTPEQLMQQGNEAYAKADYPAAIQHYNAVQHHHCGADLVGVFQEDRKSVV